MTDQSPARYDEVGPDIPLDQARLLALVVMIVVATQVWVAIDAWQLLRAIAGVPGDDPYPNDGMLLDTRLRVHLFDDRTRMNVIPAVALLVALLCLIAWMYAARRLAESYAAQGFRRGRAWTFWGWWLPIISFWFPYQSMADVWTGSDPTRRPDTPARAIRPGRLVIVWWLSLVAFVLCRSAADVVYSDGYGPVNHVRLGLILWTAAGFLSVVTAVLLALVVRAITAFERERAMSRATQDA